MYPCLIQRLCTSGCDQFVQMVLEHSPLLMRYCQTLCIQFTTLKPVADRVLVKIQAAEEKTTAGILLPSTAVSKPQGGEVVAVGEGRLIGEKKIEVSLEVCCTLHIYIHCSFSIHVYLFVFRECIAFMHMYAALSSMYDALCSMYLGVYYIAYICM